jgi:hypothetical protein
MFRGVSSYRKIARIIKDANLKAHYPLFNSINSATIAATQAAQYPQIHCSIIFPFPYFLNFFLKIARPAKPPPTNNIVAGSGTGWTAGVP